MVAPMPARVACCRFLWADSSPITAPMNGPKMTPGRPRNRPATSSDQSADDGAFGGAEFLGAKHRRPKIHGVSQSCQNRQNDYRPQADVSKIVSPCAENETHQN